jgi:hypothetical protein
MKGKREREPFIQKGDEVHITRPGGMAGFWKVAAARYAHDNETDHRIDMVLTRGGGMMFKIAFDEKTMRVKNSTPDYMLARGISVGKPVTVKRREPKP